MKNAIAMALCGLAALATSAAADTLSRSVMRPTTISSGIVAGNLPGGEGAVVYYVAVDLQKGALMTQLSVAGRGDVTKTFSVAVLNAAGQAADRDTLVTSYPKGELTKAFAIDSAGHYVLRLSVEGPETATYCLLMGGTAMPNAAATDCTSPGTAAAVTAPTATPAPVVTETQSAAAPPVAQPPVASTAAPAAADPGPAALSHSLFRPTPVTSGVVAGNMPGGDGATFYYVVVDLQKGTLMTQLSLAGRGNVYKNFGLALLDGAAEVADRDTLVTSYPKGELTKAFTIDAAGRHILRLSLEGPETGTYCLLMGGTAMPNATATECPASGKAAAAPPQVVVAAAPAPVVVAMVRPVTISPKIEVITSKCEERLRLGSDFLFDFDRADMRSEAAPTLDEIAVRLTAAGRTVMIEGHTDAKGTDGYNQTLSERRAISVRAALTARGLPVERLNIRGYGKSRPVAENERSDGSDDPEGRQRNRRVEVVLNTCDR